MLRQFIARFRNVAVVSVAATTLGIATLTGCGVKGPLKLPPPTPAATGAGAGATSPATPPATATTESPAASEPKVPETKP
jgi:predicted small lipoprotein YifL